MQMQEMGIQSQTLVQQAPYLLIHPQGQSVLPDPTELQKILSEGNSEALAFIPVYLEP